MTWGLGFGYCASVNGGLVGLDYDGARVSLAFVGVGGIPGVPVGFGLLLALLGGVLVFELWFQGFGFLCFSIACGVGII